MPNISRILQINRALNKVGADRITSLTDGSKGAEIGNLIYDESLEELIESHPWNFATLQVTLAQLSTAPSWEFAYGYQKPADCLRVIKTDLLEGEIWREHGDNIVTDSSTLGVEYIRSISDEAKFPKHFAEAHVCRMAMDFAYSFTNKASLVTEMRSQFERALALAKSFDAQSGRGDKLKANKWASLRR